MRKLFLVGSLWVSLFVVNYRVQAIGEAELQVERDAVIETIQMPIIQADTPTYAEAVQMLEELEALTLQYGDLGNSQSYIHRDFRPEGLGVSHGQELMILEYLDSYYNYHNLGANQTESQAVSTSSYAPYLMPSYYYRGAGSPLEGGNNYRKVTLQFPPDDLGYYQFVVEEYIYPNYSEITYVYQQTDAGIFEQAYFETGNDEMVDYRHHADVLNEYASLILPTEVYPGLVFDSGYSNQTPYEVIDIHASFTFMGEHYDDVIELSYGDDLRVFYAPDIGIFGEAFNLADYQGYNERYYLESFVQKETLTSNAISSDYPFAVAIEDLGEVIHFYGTGTMNVNLVEFYPESLMMNVYYDDLKDGGYSLAYRTPVQMKQVPTKEIEVTRHMDLTSHYDLGNKVKVNTQLTGANFLNPIYLYYNAAGSISLAFWNDFGGSGYYNEMLP